MKIRYSLITLTLLFIQTISATPDNIVSLEKQLLTLSSQERLPLLAELTEYYSTEAPQKAENYGKEALELLSQFPDTATSLLVGHYLSDAFITIGKDDLAAELIYPNEKLALAEGTLKQQAVAITDVAALLVRRDHNYDQAIIYETKSLKISEQLNDGYNIGISLNRIGLSHYYNVNYDEALVFFVKALEQVDYVKEAIAAYTYSNIALIHMQYAEWDKALVYYHKALAHAEQFNKMYVISEQFINTGIAYQMKEDFDKAIEYYEKAAVLQKTIDDKDSSMQINHRLGRIHRIRKNYPQALQYLNKALTSAKEMKRKVDIIQIEMQLGVVYSRMKDYHLSMQHLQTALQRALELKDKQSIIDAHMSVSNTHKLLGDYQKAYEHLSSHYKLKIERSNKGRLDKIAELEEKYKADQRESEIQRLTQTKKLEELEFQQQRIFAAGLIGLVLLITGFLFYRQSQKRKLVTERASMMAELMDQKNKMLAEVTHDLRTPLTTIKMQLEALEDGALPHTDKSYSSLQKKLSSLNQMVGDLYQLSLVETGSLVLNKQDIVINHVLCDAVESFQPLANKAQLTLTFCDQAQAELEVNADAGRLTQVFNNLLKNSIRYTDPQGKIEVLIAVAANEVVITFEDSSPGVADNELNQLFTRLFRAEATRERAANGSGLGLSIVSSIIMAHGGQVYAEHASLGGVRIVVKLPIVD